MINEILYGGRCGGGTTSAITNSVMKNILMELNADGLTIGIENKGIICINNKTIKESLEQELSKISTSTRNELFNPLTSEQLKALKNELRPKKILVTSDKKLFSELMKQNNIPQNAIRYSEFVNGTIIIDNFENWEERRCNT